MPNRKMLTNRKAVLSNRVYDVLKWVITIVLPAIAVLYFALSQIWGFPNGEQVIGTITAIEVFFGAILGLSTYQYNNSDAKYDGNINVIETPEKRTYDLEMFEDPVGLTDKKAVTFKIRDAQK